MKRMRDVIMIYIPKEQGISISEIARRIGCSCTSVRKYLRQDLYIGREFCDLDDLNQ